MTLIDGLMKIQDYTTKVGRHVLHAFSHPEGRNVLYASAALMTIGGVIGGIGVAYDNDRTTGPSPYHQITRASQDLNSNQKSLDSKMKE